MIAPDSVEASSESATTILYRGTPVEETEREKPMNLIERWRDDPAPILVRAVPNALCLMIALSLIFGLVWGMMKGASGEQALMTVIFGASVFAVSLFPFILLGNASINDTIRAKRREAERKAKTDQETQERRDRRDAATLRVIRLTLLEWAVKEDKVDKIDGLSENLLTALKEHRSEVRAQRNRPPSYARIAPVGTVI